VQHCFIACLLSLLHAYCPFHLSVLPILILRILLRSSGADPQIEILRRIPISHP
jgi:hypothetical protein